MCDFWKHYETRGDPFIIHSDASVTGKFEEETFQIKITTTGGQLIDIPVIETAPYNGDTTIHLNSGNYVITITGVDTKYAFTMTGM
ncbi:MAG: hypothetical protein WCH85_11145 [Methanomicrobiales archaeon]